MEEKLRRLMKHEGINSTRLAEILGIQASGISHIMSGRNKPSYDFLLKLLQRFPQISPDWLLLDRGPMYRDEIKKSAAEKVGGQRPDIAVAAEFGTVPRAAARDGSEFGAGASGPSGADTAAGGGVELDARSVMGFGAEERHSGSGAGGVFGAANAAGSPHGANLGAGSVFGAANAAEAGFGAGSGVGVGSDSIGGLFAPGRVAEGGSIAGAGSPRGGSAAVAGAADDRGGVYPEAGRGTAGGVRAVETGGTGLLEARGGESATSRPGAQAQYSANATQAAARSASATGPVPLNRTGGGVGGELRDRSGFVGGSQSADGGTKSPREGSAFAGADGSVRAGETGGAEAQAKDVERIVVFYGDRTFSEYRPA